MTTAMTPQLKETGLITLDGAAIHESLLPTTGPDWLNLLRREALASFNEQGLPTLRDEEWRYTSVKPIRESEFRIFAAKEPAIAASVLKSLDPIQTPGPRLVFVNGRFAPDLSDSTSTRGVEIMTFTDAFAANPDLLREHLTRYTGFTDDPFAALNTAFIEHGVLVHVGRETSAEEPIHILNVTTASADHALLVNPRNLIVVDRGARATIIEDYAALDAPGVYFNNCVTEILVGANSDVQHYMIERESESAFNISTLTARQERDSRFESHTILFGGSLVRNNVNPILDGEGIYSMLNGLYIARGAQHIDNHMRVEHRKPNGASRQYYKGILSDDSHGVFTGRIIVSQDAQKTDAVQSNQSLLLSESAQSQTRPQLEIYADDVKCTHGATVGELDENAMFYLRTRGLDEITARAMMVYAFASESLERMQNEAVRGAVRDMLLAKLPNSRMLQEVAAE